MVNLPGKVLGFFAGGIAMTTGYGGYFVLTVISIVPATLLFTYLWPRYSKDRPGDPAPAPKEGSV
jgi:PAT family beta-lactamase induction signal transducer AmpG